MSLTGALYALPALAVLAGVTALIDRPAARWLAAAAVASALPFAVR